MQQKKIYFKLIATIISFNVIGCWSGGYSISSDLADVNLNTDLSNSVGLNPINPEVPVVIQNEIRRNPTISSTNNLKPQLYSLEPNDNSILIINNKYQLEKFVNAIFEASLSEELSKLNTQSIFILDITNFNFENNSSERFNLEAILNFLPNVKRIYSNNEWNDFFDNAGRRIEVSVRPQNIIPSKSEIVNDRSINNQIVVINRNELKLENMFSVEGDTLKIKTKEGYKLLIALDCGSTIFSDDSPNETSAQKFEKIGLDRKKIFKLDITALAEAVDDTGYYNKSFEEQEISELLDIFVIQQVLMIHTVINTKETFAIKGVYGKPMQFIRPNEKDLYKVEPGNPLNVRNIYKSGAYSVRDDDNVTITIEYEDFLPK